MHVGLRLSKPVLTFITRKDILQIFQRIYLIVVLLQLVFETFEFVCQGFDRGPCFFQHLFFASGLLRVILIVVLLYGFQQFAASLPTGHLPDFSLNRFMKRVARVLIEIQLCKGFALLDP